MAVLRESEGSVPVSAVEAAWPDAAQRDRALAALLAEGLVRRAPRGRLALPD